MTVKRKSPNPEGRKPMDLTGERFGKLIVIDLHHRTYGQYHWNVMCDCGNKYIARTVLLRNGKVKSCGCLKHYNPLKIVHGHTIGRRESRTHKSWSGMMARCYNTSSRRFPDWGGRGIRVCERWHTFVNFLVDMGEAPLRMSLDRKDNDDNYELDNCKWSTIKEQNSNKRTYSKNCRIECVECKNVFYATSTRAKYCAKCRKEKFFGFSWKKRAIK